MAMFRRSPRTTTTRRTRPTLMTRLKGRHAKSRTVKTTTTKHTHHGGAAPVTTTGARSSRWGRSRRAPATHHRRKPSIGDKISGAMLKLKGSLTHRPGEKAAGTRRMRGTDGRGSHRTYY